MKTVNFCIATHNHQPIGNFDYVFEEAYEKSYFPFFECAKKYQFKFATHFSGILLAWLERNHPEHIAMLKDLVDAGRLEIISGGYYEPILAIFPKEDQLAQIRKLSSAINRAFGAVPNGMWLAERIWEPQLPSVMHDAEISYTILDDSHFRAAGLEEEDLSGYYRTEDLGKSIAIFPISKALRYTIPFSPVDETIKILRDATSESGENIIAFADDGEKFGVWPKTFDHVYKDGWLEEFFRKLDENASWLKTIHFREAIRSIPAKGKIYLPTGSYAEMMEWALPKAEVIQKYETFVHALSENKESWKENQQFVRGGFWRNFLVKYPESDHLHKRVLAASQRFASAKAPVKKIADYADAYSHLLASQCNDPYWHGVFGGIYLANLRHELYTNLLTAEKELDTLEKKKYLITNNNDAIILENEILRIQFDPARGSAISEIDYKPKAFNLSNFMNRIPEASHEKLKSAKESLTEKGESKSIHDQILTKEKGLEKRLLYDWYRHGSFIEHFLSKDTELEDLKKMSFLEHGDFFKAEMDPQVEESKNKISASFSKKGNVFFDGISHQVELKKSLTLQKNILSAKISLSNNSESNLQMRFASEWTFGLLAGDAHDRYYSSADAEISEKKLNSTGEIKNIRELSLTDEWTGFRISLSAENPCTFWRTPIETVSLSEGGFERVYQGSIIFALWDVSLSSGEEWNTSITIQVSDLSK